MTELIKLNPAIPVPPPLLVSRVCAGRQCSEYSSSCNSHLLTHLMCSKVTHYEVGQLKGHLLPCIVQSGREKGGVKKLHQLLVHLICPMNRGKRLKYLELGVQFQFNKIKFQVRAASCLWPLHRPSNHQAP